jgi:hypothetical protein
MPDGEREWGRGVRYSVAPHRREVEEGKGARPVIRGGGAPLRRVLGRRHLAWNRGGGGRLIGGVGQHGAGRRGSNGI